MPRNEEEPGRRSTCCWIKTCVAQDHTLDEWVCSLEAVVAVGPRPERRLLIDGGAAKQAAKGASSATHRGGGRVGGAVAELHLGRRGRGRVVAALQELVDVGAGGGGVER